MESLVLGFLTAGSLILAIGPQNLFVIEQGLKKNFIFTVTTICTVSDILLIFLGVFIYQIFNTISAEFEFVLNIILIFFLIRFIKEKINELKNFKAKKVTGSNNLKKVVLKTLGFTYLNPHVYSDTIFILGNLSKNFDQESKFFFALGASLSSIIFFYSLGYMSSIFANFIKNKNIWKYINIFIISFMSVLVTYIIYTAYLSIFNL
tara:strand:+ start:6683 stop:7300 length:618 start_codon:yes stop_codon:yes gene_type:complete